MGGLTSWDPNSIGTAEAAETEDSTATTLKDEAAPHPTSRDATDFWTAMKARAAMSDRIRRPAVQDAAAFWNNEKQQKRRMPSSSR